MTYGFVIDNRKCIGCHACSVACKAEHDIPLGVNRTWVKAIEKGEFPNSRRFFSVLRCNHCANAPCTAICPTTALFTRKDGIVDFDPDRCIGCKACLQGCPYDALYIDPDTNTAAKCNFCAHRVEVNLAPPCAVVCPEKAIIAGDMDDPATEIAHLIRTEQVQVRKPEKGTRPNLFYIDADTASLTPAATTNGDSYLWSQAREPGIHPGEPVIARSPDPEDGRGGLDEAPLQDGSLGVYGTGQTHMGSWGGKVSAYLWTKSIASGCLMLAPFIVRDGGINDPGAWKLAALFISLFFLGMTGILLVADLGKPARFLWVLTRPQWRSWLTRGSFILLGFSLAGTGMVLALLLDWPWLWNVLAGPAVILGGAGAVYTAFLFWQAKGRDLWQSPLLPLHLGLQAMVAGLSALILLRLVSSYPQSALHLGGTAVELWLGRSLLLSAGLLSLELFAVHQTEDGAAAARWMRTGPRFHFLFWGVILAGHLIPLTLLFLPFPAGEAIAPLLALAGLGLFEHLYVQAGQSVALT